MYLPKLREIKEALGSLFTPAYTTKFPAKPYTPEKAYRGFPEYDEPFCVGCGTCAQVCPAEAIEVEDDIKRKVRRLTVNYMSCINCGQCEEKCITQKGISCTNSYSYSSPDKKDPTATNSVEKELVLCESCGAVITCGAHLGFIRERMGQKAMANPNVLLEIQKMFAPIAKSEIKSHIRREDYIKTLCPKCRHKLVVEDEF